MIYGFRILALEGILEVMTALYSVVYKNEEVEDLSTQLTIKDPSL